MRLLNENRNKIFITGLVVLYSFSVLVNLGHLELSGEEPRRAIVSIEMFHTGNFIRPTLLGWDYYNKPPVFNWVLLFFVWFTGSASEFVMRLPSLLFYLLLAFFHYRVALNYLPAKFALLSSFFIITCGDVYFYALANGAEIDLFYSLLVYLQVISLFWYYERNKFLPLFLVSYFFCALGFLTKGFPSILFQGFTLLALCFYARTFRLLIRWQHLAGILLFSGILFLYFSLYSQYSSPYRFLTNLLNEAFLKSAIGEKHYQLPEKVLLYPFLFLKMLLPWSFFLLLLVKVKIHLRQNSLVWFSVLFIFFNLWVYWLTGQPKIRYVYMFLPFACTILVYILFRFTEQTSLDYNVYLKPFGFIFAAIALSVLVLPFFTEIMWLPALFFALLTGGLTYVFFSKERERLWIMISGIILLRLLYASLFIPLQHKGIHNYQPHVLNMLEQTNGQGFTYTAGALPMAVSVSTAFFKYHFDSVRVAPHLSYQVPYYYYRNTGRLLLFDSNIHLPGYKLSYGNQMIEKKQDTLYQFFDGTVSQQLYLHR